MMGEMNLRLVRIVRWPGVYFGLPFAAVHVFYVAIILLAHVFVHFFAGRPTDVPTAGPRLGIGARIVDGGFVF